MISFICKTSSPKPKLINNKEQIVCQKLKEGWEGKNGEGCQMVQTSL